MGKQLYRVTRADIEWVSGHRVAPDGTIWLTPHQAEAALAREQIEPAPPEAPKKSRVPDSKAE